MLMCASTFISFNSAAAEETKVVFPQGSSFGIIPFEGSSEAKKFSGFIDKTDQRSVFIVEIPLDGWEEINQGFRDPSKLAKQGIKVLSTEDIEIQGRAALRIRGTQLFQGIEVPKCILLLKGESHVAMFSAQMPNSPDASQNACDLIKEPREREPVGNAAQLAALPFQVKGFGEFRLVRVLGNSGVLMTRGPLDVVKDLSQPVLIVASSLRPTAKGQDKSDFAKQLMSQLATYEIKKSVSESKLFVAGYSAIELIAEATHRESQRAAKVVQWIAFSDDGNYLRVIGVASPSDWQNSFQQFREILDGLSWKDSNSGTPLKETVTASE